MYAVVIDDIIIKLYVEHLTFAIYLDQLVFEHDS